MSTDSHTLIETQTIQAIADLRVEMAQLNGKIDLTNQKLEAVIKNLSETAKNKKWIITNAMSALLTAATLMYFIFRVG